LILAVYLVKSPALLDKAAGGPHWVTTSSTRRFLIAAHSTSLQPQIWSCPLSCWWVQLPGGLHTISKRIQSRKIQELLDEMIEFSTGCTCRLISASMLPNCGGCSPLLHGWDRSRHEPANKREGHWLR
jgi:hypothetical protein